MIYRYNAIYMKATLIRSPKKVYPDGTVVELVLWQLPAPTPNHPHGLKYRFYCGKDGRSIVRYDNESGKGDHVHYGESEQSYKFSNPEKLIADFLNDVARLAEVN